VAGYLYLGGARVRTGCWGGERGSNDGGSVTETLRFGATCSTRFEASGPTRLKQQVEGAGPTKLKQLG
jgi:hypothetical protein